MEILRNPIVRIALGAIASQYIAPRIVNKFLGPELTESDARINEATRIGVTASITALVFVGIGMVAGESAAAAAASGT